jgi:hypothetical protein
LSRRARRRIVAPNPPLEDPMSARLLALVAVIGAFGVLTARALLEVGYLGLFETSLASWAGAQVLVDLAILALLGCLWMIGDGRARGVNPWPFVVATVFLGSFGVLFYLVRRELRAEASRPLAA